MLFETISDCTGCRMSVMGNGPVAPRGKTPNDILILGDYPPRADDKVGRVTLKGEPSQLLRRHLREGGVHLDECFYANSTQCWTQGEAGKAEIDACRLHTIKPIVQVVQPKVVLTLGVTALKTVGIKTKSVKSVHGRPHRMLAGPFIDRWVWPTWHPAAEDKPGVVTQLGADLQRFGEFYRAMDEAGWPKEGLRPWV